MNVGHFQITASVGWMDEVSLVGGGTIHEAEVIISQDGGETGTTMTPYMARALATALRSAAELAESM